MSPQYLLVLCGLLDTTHHHRHNVDRSADAIDLGIANASITKSIFESHIWRGRLVGFFVPLLLP